MEQLALVAGEVQNPQRTIRRATDASMLVAISLFVLTNVAYFSALSFEDIIRSRTLAMVRGVDLLASFHGVVSC